MIANRDRETLELWKKEIEEEMRDRMHPISYYQYTILKQKLDEINRKLKDYDCGNI
jgi:hypothetical protein